MNKLRLFLNSLTIEEQMVFAEKCGTTIKYLRKRISDRSSRLGEKICIEIEDKTSGKVKCEDLRPDVNWSVIRGRS
ncbi:transcriptional regulator [Gilliamella sp. BG2]|uniref:transcriptional regulator n=1 Tax=Gilliamella sp. BG2 TaxID=3351509 RepID=UPI0039874111